MSMAAISLESIDLCGCGFRFDSILLEEELKANEMFAKEVDIVEDRTIIECVSRLSASSAGLTGLLDAGALTWQLRNPLK